MFRKTYDKLASVTGNGFHIDGSLVTIDNMSNVAKPEAIPLCVVQITCRHSKELFEYATAVLFRDPNP